MLLRSNLLWITPLRTNVLWQTPLFQSITRPKSAISQPAKHTPTSNGTSFSLRGCNCRRRKAAALLLLPLLLLFFLTLSFFFPSLLLLDHRWKVRGCSAQGHNTGSDGAWGLVVGGGGFTPLTPAPSSCSWVKVFTSLFGSSDREPCRSMKPPAPGVLIRCLRHFWGELQLSRCRAEAAGPARVRWSHRLLPAGFL